jgi:hypothetical protein
MDVINVADFPGEVIEARNTTRPHGAGEED